MCFGMNCQYEDSTGECEKPMNAPYPCTDAEKWEDPEELPDNQEV